jgi:hypothetical protein
MASHRIVILGQRLSYPVANVGAVIVLVMAAVGLAVIAITTVGAGREFRADRRFERRMGQRRLYCLKGAVIFEDPRPRAFCAGLAIPRVYMSTGAVAVLDDAALDAVLEHERHHARNRDPLRLAVGRVLCRALFFVPGYRALLRRQQSLAELSADERAITVRPANRAALARAMLKFSDADASPGLVGIGPVRADHLLGTPPSWRFPILLCAVCGLAIALLVASAVLAGQVAVGTATLAPPFLSGQPCVVVLALIPAVLALIALRAARLFSAPRRSTSR